MPHQLRSKRWDNGWDPMALLFWWSIHLMLFFFFLNEGLFWVSSLVPSHGMLGYLCWCVQGLTSERSLDILLAPLLWVTLNIIYFWVLKMVVYFDHCYHRSLYLAYDDNYVVTYHTNFRNFLFVVRGRRLVSKGCSYSVVKLAEMVTYSTSW